MRCEIKNIKLYIAHDNDYLNCFATATIITDKFAAQVTTECHCCKDVEEAMDKAEWDFYNCAVDDLECFDTRKEKREIVNHALRMATFKVLEPDKYWDKYLKLFGE